MFVTKHEAPDTLLGKEKTPPAAAVPAPGVAPAPGTPAPDAYDLSYRGRSAHCRVKCLRADQLDTLKVTLRI